MDTRFDWQSGIAAIRKEHRRIDGKWLWMQYRLMAALAVFATAAEVIMYFLLQELRIPTVSPAMYLLKYLAAPFAVNMLLTLGAALTVRSGLTEVQKRQLDERQQHLHRLRLRCYHPRRRLCCLLPYPL